MEMKFHGPIDPDELRRLTTPEIATRLLPNLAKSQGNFSELNFLKTAHQMYERSGEADPGKLVDALSDAWAWLVAHGMIGPAWRDVTQGWTRLTSRGRLMASDPAALTKIIAEERLALDLHTSLRSVPPIFERGDFETAAFAAMKAVEVRVRELSGKPTSLLGTKLMQEAFAPVKPGGTGGPLVDADADGGEQVAIMNLFSGAIGAFKNPPSHRTVTYDDPAEAAEVVLLGDLLMRLLDKVERRLS